MQKQERVEKNVLNLKKEEESKRKIGRRDEMVEISFKDRKVLLIRDLKDSSFYTEEKGVRCNKIEESMNNAKNTIGKMRQYFEVGQV